MNYRFLVIGFWLLIACETSATVYSRYDSLKVVNLLEEVRDMTSTDSPTPNAQRPTSFYTLHFARKLIGVKYENYVLEQTRSEQLIIDLRRLDCTTFVETVAALAISAKHKEYTFHAFCRYLQKLRYRDGRIEDFSSRLHYFTDWIRDNVGKGYVSWPQQPNPPFTEVKSPGYNIMTKLRKSYRQIATNDKLLNKIARCEENLKGLTFRYIPKALLNGGKKDLACIGDGDIICMVTSAECLDVAHLGIAVWHGDKLHMIDASKIHGKVFEEVKTMYQYQRTKQAQIGIIVVKLK